jgi:hypothetical protein
VSEDPQQSLEAESRHATGKRGILRRWQVGVRTLFLLMAAIAVWISCFINYQQIRALEQRIAVLMPLAHDLVVEDEARIAVVKLEEQWIDDNRWDLHLPKGPFRLCLATQGIADDGLVPPAQSCPIKPGRHRLALQRQLDKGMWRIAVTCDGAAVLRAEEPEKWAGSGSSSTGPSAVTEHFPADKPFVLLRLRFQHWDASGAPEDPSAPSSGILLWIERADQSRDRQRTVPIPDQQTGR